MPPSVAATHCNRDTIRITQGSLSWQLGRCATWIVLKPQPINSVRPGPLMVRLYLKAPFHLEFKRPFPHLKRRSHCRAGNALREDAVLLHPLRSEQLETLADQVRTTDEPTSELVSAVLVGTARRLSLPSSGADAVQLRQFIDAGALTEAALALIDAELPQWKLRRITYDEGEWHCALSRERELPDWLDQAVEVRHASLTLAILSAYIETVRQIEMSREPSRPSVPQTPREREQYEPVCCDNFA